MVTPMAAEAASAASSGATPAVLTGSVRAGGSGGTRVVLHPLVLMNVSDHHTRFVAMGMFPGKAAANAARVPENVAPSLRGADGRVRVVGILLGEQDGAAVEVCHSFELPAALDAATGEAVIDAPFMERRIEQYKQIFPRYAVVGWYSTGGTVTPDDLRLHTQIFSTLHEAPVLLVVNPGIRPKPAPTVQAFQAEMHMAGDALQTLLAPVEHVFASAEAERIAVDHVSRHAIPGAGDAVSNTIVHLTALRHSIGMLQTRVAVIMRFLAAVESGEVPKDHALLRNVAGVCARLPAVSSPQLDAAFRGECDDSTVVGYLSGVTKSLCALNELVSKFGFAYDKPAGTDVRRKGHFLL